MEKVNGDYYIKCDPQFVPKGTKCITETCWRGYKLSHDGSMCEPDCENPEKNRLCGMPNMGYGAQYDHAHLFNSSLFQVSPEHPQRDLSPHIDMNNHETLKLLSEVNEH
ncbi:hypothetical protein MP638_001331, partial [Amoeboaphelidium occidentale]